MENGDTDLECDSPEAAYTCSVIVFQLDRYRTNSLMLWAPPVTVRDSNTSNVGPPYSSNDEEVPMEVDQQA
ncbi:hypothetical protein INR49_004060 [Caranx melampygus]|nr:hypothetical protein INR49_004060 [Caranx melampygus]